MLKRVQHDKNTIKLASFLGIAYGLALASKISALYFLPIIIIALVFLSLKTKSVFSIAYCLLPIAFFSYLSFRIFDTHTFSGSFLSPTINPQFVQNIKELKVLGARGSMFPPAVQWLTVKPLIFPLKNIILWGLGLPLGILAVLAVFYSAFKVLKSLRYPKLINRLTNQQISLTLILSWILFLFIYQGIQYTPSMRYFLPISPFLAIISANFSIKYLFPKFKKSYIPYSIFYILIILWPLSFISIYSRPHSRITASEWIYENIPAGATLSCEHWDDCLPLSLGSKSYSFYKIETLNLYDPDTPEKWRKINLQLEKVDYIIMSSNRLWGSIPKAPEKYPITSKFYNDLFAEKLQFIKVAEITSYPTIPILNISIPDDLSEEAFTVYDHPKVLIYNKQN